MPAAGSESLVWGGEVDVFGAGHGEGGFFERPVQPFGSVAGLAGAAFAGGFVVAGVLSGPAGEVFGGREYAHVDPDLGDNDLGGAPLNAGDRPHQLNGFLERGDLLSDRFGQPGDLFVQQIEVVEDRLDPHCVQMIEATLQRSRSAGIFARSLPLASSVSASGSVVPATSASSITRPALPRMLVATFHGASDPMTPKGHGGWWSRSRAGRYLWRPVPRACERRRRRSACDRPQMGSPRGRHGRLADAQQLQLAELLCARLDSVGAPKQSQRPPVRTRRGPAVEGALGGCDVDAGNPIETSAIVPPLAGLITDLASRSATGTQSP